MYCFAHNPKVAVTVMEEKKSENIQSLRMQSENFSSEITQCWSNTTFWEDK